MLSINPNIIIGLVSGGVFMILIGLFIFIIIFRYRKRQSESKHEIEVLESRFSQTLLQAQLEIQEQTLKTISQEIHDNIGQVLSLAKLNLNTIDTTQQESLQEKITDSKNLVSKAIHDLRDLSKSFNTDNIAAMGLLRAVEYQLDMIRKTGYETILEVSGDTVKMEPQKELIIFRIVQETLNNIIKHAEAKKIVVTANYAPNKLELKVQDNGQGVDLAPLNEKTDTNFGLGIRNMHNRATIIGADFKMTSILGEGTLVNLNIPITKQLI